MEANASGLTGSPSRFFYADRGAPRGFEGATCLSSSNLLKKATSYVPRLADRGFRAIDMNILPLLDGLQTLVVRGGGIVMLVDPWSPQ